MLGITNYFGIVLSLWPRVIWPVLFVPAIALAWEPGVIAPAPTGGFTVDTSNRNDVVSFYHAIYLASEGYENRIAWTGNYTSEAAGAEGTISPVFVEDVERRLNYFRAMSGVQADVSVNSGATVRIMEADPHKPSASTTKAAAAQRSALMIARTYPNNGGLSHSPTDAACVAWTPAAWNANKNGNLALGFFGPGAIESYMKEDVAGVSSWNTSVGHRRWVMHQRSTDFGTGDTPGQASGTIRPPTNALYVVPNAAELDPDLPPVFAAYPPKGFVPAKFNTPYWSLSYPGANFSTATVSMTNAALSPVSNVTVVSRAVGYGDNSIVWSVPATVSAKSVSSDTRWSVTVSNIQGEGVPASYSYSVTLIDPDHLLETPTLSGPSSVLSVGAEYEVAGVPGADQMETGFFLRKSATWTEGAEVNPTPMVIDRTTGTGAGDYDLFSTNSAYKRTGSRSFRLTFPTLYDLMVNGVPEQSFEVVREIVPVTNPKLNFFYKRGLMTQASHLVVEVSQDGGTTWTLLADYQGKSNGSADAAFQAASLSLPTGGNPLRVRFRYYLQSGGSAYSHEAYPAQPTGIYIDDITVSGCDWLEPKGSVSDEGLESFVFNSTTAGTPLAVGQTWWLRPRAILGGKAFPYGPAKVVTATGLPDTFAGWASTEYPGPSLSFNGDLDGDGLDDGIEYAFSLDPTRSSPVPEELSFPVGKIEIARDLPIHRVGVVYGAQWSEDLVNWSSQGVTIRFEDGKIIASVMKGLQSRFLRWNITPQ